MKTLITNRKAKHKFNLLAKWTCGIVLKGAEVKSIRAGEVSFKDAFARYDDGEVFLYNLYIQPYEMASYATLDAERPRKLLLHKREIKKIIGSISGKGMTLVPTKMFMTPHGFVKVEIALAQGKQHYDKRDDIKRREVDRTIRRAIKG